MFKIEYRIVLDDVDDLSGEDGFIKLSSNEFTYGEIYSKEIEQHIGRESLYYWFIYFMQAVIGLKKRDYVLIMDIEASRTWLEIKKDNNFIYTSIIHADYEIGSTAVEFHPMPNTEYLDWHGEETDFEQFKDEVLSNAKSYYKQLCDLNLSLTNDRRLINFKQLLEKLIQM